MTTQVTDKECRLCHVVKPAGEFYASNQNRDGLYSYCKACQIAKQRRVQKESPRRRVNPPGMRWCRTCKAYKTPDNFWQDANQFDGLSLVCRECRNNRRKTWYEQNRGREMDRQKQTRRDNPERWLDYEIKTRYGLPYGSYARMFAEQHGLCGICNEPPAAGARLHVDHCHDTNTVRGLLCGRCNTGIGQLRHSKQLLLSAVEYLSNYELAIGRTES